MSDSSTFDPEKIIGTLASHKVRYVLIGALAARLQGFPRHTSDADITPSDDFGNLENLAAALIQLKAKIFTASLEDIIKSKKAADRPQDRQDIIILKEILDRGSSH